MASRDTISSILRAHRSFPSVSAHSVASGRSSRLISAIVPAPILED
jgi:hypothetical protein